MWQRKSMLRAGGVMLLLPPCLVTSARATTYQVGPGRTYASPSAVANLLAPGDVVEIDGNHTYAGGVVFSIPGTTSQKITIRGIRVGGQRPILSGGNNTIEAQANHYVFEGLDLTAGSSRCFYHHADDIVLRDSVVHDCPLQGVLGADGDSGDLLMEYVEVHHCGGGTQNHQIYMATDETAYPGSVFRMQHCFVHDANGGNAVKSRAERNEIYHNWIEGALYHELELIGPDGQDPSLAREDSDVVGNVLVKRNTFHVVRFGGDGTGETFGRYRFVNNTVVILPGGSAVFRLFDGIESVEMHNNVFAIDGSGTVNIVRMVEANWSTGSPLIAGSNNWISSGASNLPAQWTGTLEQTSPGLIDLHGNDPRPAAGSPLIDAGATTTSGPPGYPFPLPLGAPAFLPPLHAVEPVGTALARPQVGTIDIGAFEYGASTGAGGSSAAGGTQSSAGASGQPASGSAGLPNGGVAGTAGGSAASPEGSNCGCRVASQDAGRSGWMLAFVLTMGTLRRRTRGRSHPQRRRAT
jgi:MYXO-CTERM domain-containing protein